MDYDQIAKEFYDYEKDAITDRVLGHENVFKLLGDIRGKTVLDYGCGSGKFSRLLIEKGAIVEGFDISEKEIEIAKLDESQIFYTNSIDDIQNHKFDAVVLNFVLCTISSTEEQSKILKNIYHLLKSGGQLVILNPNHQASNGRKFISFEFEFLPELISGKSLKALLGKNRELELTDYYWSLEDYKNVLEQTGFVIQDVLEPKATDDSQAWIDEKEYPPFILISSYKQ